MPSTLFSPIRLGSVELDNRIVIAPMCQYSAVDGCATDWHLAHLGVLANSGASLVIVEATHVERHGRITHGCMGLYSDECEAALKRVVDFCRRAGTAKLGIQLAHAGRKASVQRPWEGGGPLKPGQDPWLRLGRPHCRSGPAGTPRAPWRRMISPTCAAPSRRRRSAPCGSASTSSNCTWRMAIWPTASSRRSPTSAPINMAARWKIAC